MTVIHFLFEINFKFTVVVNGAAYIYTKAVLNRLNYKVNNQEAAA